MNDETGRDATTEHDATLRQAFGRLREEEHRLGPDYAALRDRRDAPAATKRPFEGWSPAWPAAALAAIAGFAWLILTPSPPETTKPAEPGFQVGAWSMPTDVLLDLSALPGSAVMGDIEGADPIQPPPRDDARWSETQEETRWG